MRNSGRYCRLRGFLPGRHFPDQPRFLYLPLFLSMLWRKAAQEEDKGEGKERGQFREILGLRLTRTGKDQG